MLRQFHNSATDPRWGCREELNANAAAVLQMKQVVSRILGFHVSDLRVIGTDNSVAANQVFAKDFACDIGSRLPVFPARPWGWWVIIAKHGRSVGESGSSASAQPLRGRLLLLSPRLSSHFDGAHSNGEMKAPRPRIEPKSDDPKMDETTSIASPSARVHAHPSSGLAGSQGKRFEMRRGLETRRGQSLLSTLGGSRRRESTWRGLGSDS